MAPHSPQLRLDDLATLVWCEWAREPPYVSRRRGLGNAVSPGTALWGDRWWEHVHSRELLKEAADLGFNLLLSHYYHGFGLAFEASEVGRTRQLVEAAAEFNLQVVGTVAVGDFQPEALAYERPDCLEWVAVAHEAPAVHGCARPCPSSQDCRDYLSEVCRRGVGEVGLAGVLLDFAEPPPCQCDRCSEAFRQYLQATCPGDPRERLGLPGYAHVSLPPPRSIPVSELDPLEWEARRFRSAQQAALLSELATATRETRPEALVIGTATHDVGLRLGGVPLDGVVVRSRTAPGLNEGRIVSLAPTCKLGRAHGCRVLADCAAFKDDGRRAPLGVDTLQLSVAEAAAFGGLPGCNWLLLPGPGGAALALETPLLRETLTEALQFVKVHADLYQGGVSLANVALLHSQDPRHGGSELRRYSASNLEEILLRGQILFEVHLADAVSSLANYDLVILADQLCLSEAVCQRLRQYLDQGGSLLLLGAVGSCDENHRLRAESPFAALRDHPRVVCLEDTTDERPVEQPQPAVPNVRPAAFDEVIQAVASLLDVRRPIQVSGPEEVFVEGYRLPAGRRAFHFVDYATPRRVEGMTVSLPAPFDTAVWHRLGESPPAQLSPGDGETQLALPPWQTYGILVLAGGSTGD